MQEFADFLGSQPPFDALTADDLARLARQVQVEYFATGTVIVQAGAAPLDHLYVIRTGAVEILDRSRVVDLLAPGDTFGHISVLTGLAPALSARAAEDTLCYRLPDPRTVVADASPLRFSHFGTMIARDRLTRGGLLAGPQTPVTRHMRPIVWCDGAARVREVAEAIGQADQSSALLRSADGIGIVTDHDFRSRVATGEVGVDAPAAAIMTTPVAAVPATATVATAFVHMVKVGVHHLVVTDGGRPAGILRAMDLAAGRLHPRLRGRALRRAPGQPGPQARRPAPDIVTGPVDGHRARGRAGHDPGTAAPRRRRRPAVRRRGADTRGRVRRRVRTAAPSRGRRPAGGPAPVPLGGPAQPGRSHPQAPARLLPRDRGRPGLPGRRLENPPGLAMRLRTRERAQDGPGWSDVEYCAVDVETTGLDLRRDSIVSIGLAPVHDGRICCDENYYSLVRPDCPVSVAAMRVHSLRAADLAAAPAAADVANLIAARLSGRVIVAHAAWIERAFLRRLLRRAGAKLTSPMIDTAALARALGHADGTAAGHEPSLELLARRLALPVYAPHNALGDAVTTAAVFLALATRAGPPGEPASARSLLALSARHAS